MQIHKLGEDGALMFGESDDAFASRSDFLDMLGASDQQFAKLTGRRLLVELVDGGLGLPDRMGLLPGERKPPPGAVAGLLDAGPAAPKTRRPGEQRSGGAGQRTMLMPITGGLSGGGSTETLGRENFSASEILGASRGDSLDTATATTEGINLQEGSGGSSSPPAGEGNFSDETFTPPEIFGGPASGGEATEGAPADKDVPEWVAVAGRLTALVGLTRAVTVAETEAVRGWLHAGLAEADLRGIFEVVLRREKRPARPALTYFTGAVREALEARGKDGCGTGAANRQAAPPAPVLSPEEAVVAERLKATGHPHAPSLADFAAGSRIADLAMRWLETHDAWARSDRRRRIRMCDFTNARLNRATFEGDLARVEEELSGPDE
jgi:hypothetical protein